MFKTHQESSETRLNLWNGEFLFGLDFIMELSSLQKLNTDINWILWLVNLIKPHKILMVEFPHQLYFID